MPFAVCSTAGDDITAAFLKGIVPNANFSSSNKPEGGGEGVQGELPNCD